jgi:acetyl-CoA C-acetyltransferase
MREAVIVSVARTPIGRAYKGAFNNMLVTDKETKQTSEQQVTLKLDEGNRPKTTLADLQKLQPVFKDGQRVKQGKYVTAGNASQLSDGAAALVMMEAKEAARRGLTPLGAYRGLAVAGCGPEEMGIGPVFAVARLLQRKRRRPKYGVVTMCIMGAAGLFEIY